MTGDLPESPSRSRGGTAAGEDVVVAADDLVEESAVDPDDRQQDGATLGGDQRGKLRGLLVEPGRPAALEFEEGADAARSDGGGEFARVDAEPLEVFGREVDPTIDRVLADVADNVRELERDAARRGEALGFAIG